MDAELDQRPAIDRYRCLLNWLEHPQFDSVEEAEDHFSELADGESAVFILLTLGSYTVYRISPHRHDVSNVFSFSRWQLIDLRRDAAIDLGEELLREMGL